MSMTLHDAIRELAEKWEAEALRLHRDSDQYEQFAIPKTMQRDASHFEDRAAELRDLCRALGVELKEPHHDRA